MYAPFYKKGDYVYYFGSDKDNNIISVFGKKDTKSGVFKISRRNNLEGGC